jgi:hypothetical protein
MNKHTRPEYLWEASAEIALYLSYRKEAILWLCIGQNLSFCIDQIQYIFSPKFLPCLWNVYMYVHV